MGLSEGSSEKLYLAKEKVRRFIAYPSNSPFLRTNSLLPLNLIYVPNLADCVHRVTGILLRSFIQVRIQHNEQHPGQ